jgi:hypothetical protein
MRKFVDLGRIYCAKPWICEENGVSKMIQTPYLLFLGDAPDQLAAKVARGIADWRPENSVGQFRMKAAVRMLVCLT